MKLIQLLDYAEGLEAEVGKPLRLKKCLYSNHYYIADILYDYNCDICGKTVKKTRHDLPNARCPRCTRVCNEIKRS